METKEEEIKKAIDRDGSTIADVMRETGVNRKTATKWLDRFVLEEIAKVKIVGSARVYTLK